MLPAPLHRVGLRVAYRLLRVYWRIWRPRTEGVCIAVVRDDELLLVRHSYKRGHGLPAGGRRRGEAPRAAAARELREEVGLAVGEDRLRPAGHLVTHDLGKEDRLDVFELHLDGEPALRIDGREILAARFHRLEEAVRLALLPEARAWLERRAQSTDSAV